MITRSDDKSDASRQFVYLKITHETKFEARQKQMSSFQRVLNVNTRPTANFFLCRTPVSRFIKRRFVYSSESGTARAVGLNGGDNGTIVNI
jgi:hypothetical protein